MTSKLFLVAAALGVGAYAVSSYGRAKVAQEFAWFGDDAQLSQVAGSLSFVDAFKAGARALVGKRAYPPLEVKVSQ